MKRRTFLKYSSISVFTPGIVSSLHASQDNKLEKLVFPENLFTNIFEIKKDDKKDVKKVEIKDIKRDVKKEIKKDNKKVEIKEIKEEKEIVEVKKEIIKNDIFLEEKYINDFITVRNKLKLIQNHVGYGNFNILGFDEMLKTARYNSKIGKFTKKELEFLEFIFYYDPSVHGFYGDRISVNITDRINRKDIVKIPHSGHFLFKGGPEKTYLRMREDIGDTLILTSGIRSIVKQTKLFLDKLDSSNANLSVASKSLAPPAHTYHAIADFDVGKKGFGHANFSSRFALTQEFLKMRKLKYIDMRYTINNKDGVRYEPWHVKII